MPSIWYSVRVSCANALIAAARLIAPKHDARWTSTTFAPIIDLRDLIPKKGTD